MTHEALKHYLKNAVVNAKEVLACFENHASDDLKRETIARLIGFLEGGYDMVCLEKEKS